MICVSIASNTVNELNNKIKKALNSGASFIEIRVDYLNNINKNSLSYLKQFTNISIPIIFTLRKYSEGGIKDIDEEFRLKLINELINLSPSYIDLEYSIGKKEILDLIRKCRSKNVKIILSYHNFNQTFSEEKILSLIKSMQEFDVDILKLIFMAQNIFDNNKIFNVYKNLNKNNYEIVMFCMGKYGIISRLLSPFYGAKFTFASLDIATAPGQISIKDMQMIYEILKLY